MVEPLIEARGLCVERGRRTVLCDIDLAVRPGELVAVLGPNGAGKSTLLRALAGLLPYRGEVRLGGADSAQLAPRERARRLALVPQESALRSPLPVHELVAQGRYLHRGGLAGLRAPDLEAIARALAATDMQALAERPFTALSGGEQRRALIARALATGAPALCLDEPSAALDVGHALALYALLRQLAHQGYAIALTLHALGDALEHCDRALLLAGGRCARAGAVAQVIAEEPVREVYGVELERGGGLAFRLPRLH